MAGNVSNLKNTSSRCSSVSPALVVSYKRKQESKLTQPLTHAITPGEPTKPTIAKGCQTNRLTSSQDRVLSDGEFGGEYLLDCGAPAASVDRHPRWPKD